jgi:hypothetical protein
MIRLLQQIFPPRDIGKSRESVKLSSPVGKSIFTFNYFLMSMPFFHDTRNIIHCYTLSCFIVK